VAGVAVKVTGVQIQAARDQADVSWARNEQEWCIAFLRALNIEVTP
jgi:hypothetical protein